MDEFAVIEIIWTDDRRPARYLVDAGTVDEIVGQDGTDVGFHEIPYRVIDMAGPTDETRRDYVNANHIRLLRIVAPQADDLVVPEPF